MLGGLEDNITDVLGLHQPLCTLSQVAASVVLERPELNFEWLSALWMMWAPNKFVAENENLKLLVNQT